MITVKHQPEQKRFATSLENGTAFTAYMVVGEKIIFTHTEVPIGHEGQGIGSALAKTALDYARDQNLKVMPICPYVGGYIKKHPEYKDLLLDGFSVD
jgi:predicted GNAT family acetyltransferase